jgi:hypothetical protein
MMDGAGWFNSSARSATKQQGQQQQQHTQLIVSLLFWPSELNFLLLSKYEPSALRIYKTENK